MFSAVEEHSVKKNWSPRQVHIKRVLAGIFLIRSSPVQSNPVEMLAFIHRRQKGS